MSSTSAQRMAWTLVNKVDTQKEGESSFPVEGGILLVRGHVSDR